METYIRRRSPGSPLETTFDNPFKTTAPTWTSLFFQPTTQKSVQSALTSTLILPGLLHTNLARIPSSTETTDGRETLNEIRGRNGSSVSEESIAKRWILRAEKARATRVLERRGLERELVNAVVEEVGDDVKPTQDMKITKSGKDGKGYLMFVLAVIAAVMLGFITIPSSPKSLMLPRPYSTWPWSLHPHPTHNSTKLSMERRTKRNERKGRIKLELGPWKSMEGICAV
ncbi:hypothetical protein BC829DRAFT_395079 [Chytridium lagenaria]|nr:hypothetical protein BC829DRAFT_395079 [Chytridium lagenaria]